MSSPRLQKYFCFLPTQISSLIRTVLSQQRGVAHVTNAGRDAVDAAARETNAVCLRTAKSCGSDAPIVGVKSAIRSAGDGVKKRGHRGEREVSRKTIARGMPGRSGVTVVTNSYACFILHARPRAHCAPGIPCALYSQRGEMILQTSGVSRRENADAHVQISVIARSKATKQSTLTSRQHGLLRGACHRARIRATRWLA